MKEKFNVGDLVVVRDDLKVHKRYGHIVMLDAMANYMGRVCLVEEVTITGALWCVLVDGDDDLGYYFMPQMVRPVYEKIVIYREKNSNRVVAVSQYTKKKAIARCAPEDVFDFMVGADIAFNRLTNPDYKTVIKEPVKEDTIDVGDIVQIIDTGRLYTTYTDWVLKNVSDMTLVAKYAYGDELGYTHGCKQIASTFKVVATDGRGMCYVKRYDGACYLVYRTGLKKIGHDE